MRRAAGNLGLALGTLGERESGTARLDEAVAAYRLALEERTRERVPLDWAMTQSNLGNALLNRILSLLLIFLSIVAIRRWFRVSVEG